MGECSGDGEEYESCWEGSEGGTGKWVFWWEEIAGEVVGGAPDDGCDCCGDWYPPRINFHGS